MPTPDHIVIVVEENHDADQVIGSANAPYINDTLLKNGLYYSNAHGTDHPSQPNYLEMFAGANPGVQGVNSPLQQHYPAGTETTSAGQNALNHGDDYNTAQPFSVPNLGAELLQAGYSFAGYSEDQPSVGFTGAQANGINGNRSYVEKHNAWAQFQGTGPNQLPAATNQPFTAFQSIKDFANLPNVSFVVPNEYNDMHDTVSKNGLYADPTMGKDASGNSLDKYGAPVNDAGTIQDGDTWLSNNLEAYRQWATTHNSLLVTVWDENDYDFTNPNNIPMIVDGDPRLVQPGVNSAYVNHFDLLKTLESDYGLSLTGVAATADGLAASGHGKLLADPKIGIQPDAVFGTTTHEHSSIGGEISDLYDAVLGRAPDPLGMESWASALKTGMSVHDLAQALLSSQEAQARIGASDNATFVEQLYGTALHRHSDPDGLHNWTDALSHGMSRADVALAFASSAEHLNDTQGALNAGVFVPDQTASDVARLYYGILDRAPDAVGLSDWVSAVQHGTSLTNVAGAFIGSKEFATSFSSVSDAQFVDTLYEATLGRHAEASGLQSWTNQLAHGASRADVAIGIAESPEAHSHLVASIEAGWHLA